MIGPALRRFLKDSRAGVATITALSLPVLAVLAVGAIDLSSVNTDRTKAQDVADMAALNAAKQLTLSDASSIKARAKAYVEAELTPLKSRFDYTVDSTVSKDGGSLTVKISGRRMSFFGNLLPPGGWKISTQATASVMGRAPLCVLAAGTEGPDHIKLKEESRITAPNCMVYGDSDIEVANSGWLQAAAVQAAGLARGRISPAPQAGAPVIEDPFTAIDLTPPWNLANLNPPVEGKSPIKLNLGKGRTVLCNPVDLLLDAGVQVLTPGVHCGNVTVMKNAVLKVMPGEHYFVQSHLNLSENSQLQGDDVVLLFDKDSDFTFKDSSQINLTGRKTGQFAGFVLVTTRTNDHTFEISSNSARQLLGTIYIPNAVLSVTGVTNSIADQSAWTVVVAKSIEMKGSPNLVINANYSASSVPVPTGVGPTSNDVALVN